MKREPQLVYTEHLRFRMKLRGISQSLPVEIWKESKERYYDRATGHSIAVMTCKIKERVRNGPYPTMRKKESSG